MPDREIKARFIEPMLLLPAENPPQDGHWTYELKLDGFRAEAIKTGTRPGWASRWRIDGGRRVFTEQDLGAYNGNSG